MLLAGIGPFGPWELIIIAFIVVLVFGVGRLPEVGGALGKGIREFRRSTKDEDDENTTDSVASSRVDDAVAAPPASDIFCGECGTKNPRGAKFCAECGHTIGAAVG